ncbi:unnamed protein product [Durusdinium trenchii]|uniref:SNF2 N-terminal domain-containing protein n=1 Tax=Durusdinium trenchii TaxID=1381693 RepID=A0ABP0QV01_9DINO
MESDYVSLSVRMRKPWSKEVEGLQKVCGAFIAACARYHELVPKEFADKTLPEIKKAFMHRHADADLQALLNETVPPLDVSKIMIFQSHLSKYHTEAMMDFKFLNDRYMRGKAKVVQQRGIGATKSILLGLLDGMTEPNVPVLVVDLLPSRFSEWSSACWEIQRDYLLGTDQSIDLRFLAVYQNDEASFLKAAQDLRVGRAMDQWWDKSDEAGPRSRENVRFQQDPPSLEVLSATVGTGTLIPDMVRDKFLHSYEEPLKRMADRLLEETLIINALKSCGGASQRDESTANAARTAANPEWNGEFPWNFRKRMTCSGTHVADFDSGNTIEASATLARENKLEIVFTTMSHLWVVNRGTEQITIDAGELFGFNTGSYVEIPAGSAPSATDYLPWHLADDRALVCCVKSEGDKTSKTIQSVAETMCSITRLRGVTETRVVDHDLAPLVKAMQCSRKSFGLEHI